ncbi:MAG: hypothetical protein H3C51_09950 [Rubellimicrobium sp.]|nr:hypothetical protein [Rubellimicrobium sp.]
MRDPRDPDDPKGLVRESYRIEGITVPDCRVIFLDWALSLAVDADMVRAIGAMLDRYGDAAPDHPMTATLRAGLADAASPRRRGGAMGRRAEG